MNAANDSDFDLAYFKSLLAERERAILAQLEGSSDTDTVELDQTRNGRLTRMDAMQQQAMAEALHTRLKNELSAIKQALRRIDAGDYGYCVECDELINPKRLEITPTTLYCIACADSAR